MDFCDCIVVVGGRIEILMIAVEWFRRFSFIDWKLGLKLPIIRKLTIGRIIV